MDLRVGDTFGRYRIDGVLGQGGMGRVYRAHDTRLERNVALKILALDGVAPATDGPARMLREARAAAALDHPNVIAVYDVGESEGVPFIAMELVPGKSLRAYIGDDTLPLDRKVRWLRDIAVALAAAHRRGLVHRDVKPENVMIRDDGVVKVLDFGIARRPHASVDPTAPTQSEGMNTLTGQGVVIGTPMYMAPEQLHGEGFDGRTDQFAWGVLAYELLSGRLPWAGDVLQYIAAIAAKAATSLVEVSPAVPPHVAAVVERALAKARGERFASMDDVARALDERKGARPRTIAIVVVVAAAIGVGAAMLGLPRGASRGATSGAPAASASASAAPTAITDLPVPASSSVEAIAAFKAGLQSLRDGSGGRTIANFERAAQLDPGMAAAQLRLASAFLSKSDYEEARAALAKTNDLRQALDERDRFTLDVIAALVAIPPNYALATERARAALARFPMDADLHLLMADVVQEVGDDAVALVESDRALALDPLFGGAFLAKVFSLLGSGATEDALRVAGECVERMRGATTCLGMRATVLGFLGRCEAMSEATATFFAAAPTDSLANRLRMMSLSALGRGDDAVREAMRQSVAASSPGGARRYELEMSTRHALLRGEFSLAETSARELDIVTRTSSSLAEHSSSAGLLTDVLLETGRAADATQLAQAFLQKREAWAADADAESDVTPRMLELVARAGKLPRAEQRAQRQAWIDRLRAASPRSSKLTWLFGLALPVETKEGALEAIDALPQYVPLPLWRWELNSLFAEGKTYVLAGRPAEAIAPLRRVTQSCFALLAPVTHTRAHHFLGLALEATGDKAGACAAYGVVARRWGKARAPASITAAAASLRAAMLRCGG